MLRGEQEDCATSNLKTSGNKVTFTLTCGTGDDRVLSDNEITVVGDTITTVAVSRFDGKVSSLKGTAKRVGECPK